MKKMLLTGVLCALVVGVAGPAWAQSRPLATEDPETVGAGQVLLETGFDYRHAQAYPASGLEGNLWRLGTFGVSIGVSSIAELQLDGGIRNRLRINDRSAAPLSDMLTVTGDSTSDVEDLVIGAKVRFLTEGQNRPSMAFRFATKLPNAGNESGLGLDTTDFAAGFAIAKTIQSIRVVGNIGAAILSDPVRGDRQNDVVTYGISVARAVRQGVEVVAEVNGHANTRGGTPIAGTESRSMMRVGGRFTRGAVRLDTALLFGVTDRDPTWGITTGLTWVFNAFRVP